LKYKKTCLSETATGHGMAWHGMAWRGAAEEEIPQHNDRSALLADLMHVHMHTFLLARKWRCWMSTALQARKKIAGSLSDGPGADSSSNRNADNLVTFIFQ
jgi:hypothetical protein